MVKCFLDSSEGLLMSDTVRVRPKSIKLQNSRTHNNPIHGSASGAQYVCVAVFRGSVQTVLEKLQPHVELLKEQRPRG